jgi:hypothetical protein
VAAKYHEIYPDIKIFLLDPTPPFILQKLNYISGGTHKKNNTLNYVNLFKNVEVWNYPIAKTYVLFNTENSDPNAIEQIKYIYQTFDADNIYSTTNKTHFMHITVPNVVLNFLLSYLDK